jgi:hypothetical protein
MNSFQRYVIAPSRGVVALVFLPDGLVIETNTADATR